MTTETTVKTATISLEEMVDLRRKGVSLAQIGKMAGISRQAVAQRLERSGLDPSEIARFRKDKSLILHGKQKLLLDHIDAEAVKKMAPRDRVLSFGILYDKGKLEDGGSVPGSVNITLIAERAAASQKFLETYRNDRCTGCNAWTVGVREGFCPDCRKDAESRKALPAPVPEVTDGEA